MACNKSKVTFQLRAQISFRAFYFKNALAIDASKNIFLTLTATDDAYLIILLNLIYLGWLSVFNELHTIFDVLRANDVEATLFSLLLTLCKGDFMVKSFWEMKYKMRLTKSFCEQYFIFDNTTTNVFFFIETWLTTEQAPFLLELPAKPFKIV